MSQVNIRALAHNDRSADAFEVDGAAAVRIAVGHGPISDLAAGPDGRRLFAVNYGHGSVSVIDAATRLVTETVTGLDEAFTLALGGHDGSRVYVSTAVPAYDAVTVLDTSTNAVTATHSLELSVDGLAVSPDGAHVYAGRSGARGADLAVLDSATGRIDTVDLAGPGTATQCVRVSADGTRVYAATNGPEGGRLVALRGPGDLRVADTVGIGLAVRDVALSTDGTTAYVGSCIPALAAVIDVVDARTHKITATHKIDAVAGLLTRLTLSADGTRAYLVSGDGVAVLSTRTFDVLSIIEPADEPSCVVESADASHLYIADYSGGVTAMPIGCTAESPAARGEFGRSVRELEPALA